MIKVMLYEAVHERLGGQRRITYATTLVGQRAITGLTGTQAVLGVELSQPAPHIHARFVLPRSLVGVEATLCRCYEGYDRELQQQLGMRAARATLLLDPDDTVMVYGNLSSVFAVPEVYRAALLPETTWSVKQWNQSAEGSQAQIHFCYPSDEML